MQNDNKQKSYFTPFLLLVFLFFVVGFLTTANGQFQAPLKTVFLQETGTYKNTLIMLITFSWFLAYPIMGRIGARWVETLGYKVTMIRALLIMIVGLALFYFSAWFTLQFADAGIKLDQGILPYGFFIFLMGSFVVGSSATVLQVVINPYLTACNVTGTQPIQRLAIGGTANALGNTLAPFFVGAIVFGNTVLEDVDISQLPMPFLVSLVIMIIITLLANKMTLPDIEETRNVERVSIVRSIWSFRHLTLGVIAVFFYVGAEVAVGANINMYVIQLLEQGDQITFLGRETITFGDKILTIPALIATFYWSGTLVGRLIGSTLKTIPPRVQLLTTVTLAVFALVIGVLFRNPWVLMLLGLFHSIMWGGIYTLATAKLGPYRSRATGIFMIGVVGGAIIPLLQGIWADVAGTWQSSWWLILGCEIFILYYATLGHRVRISDNLDEK